MQYRTRVKFCGITRLEDAQTAVDVGVDALGFVFFPSSPRHVSLDTAARIIALLPPFVTTVGLFVNASTAEIVETMNAAPIDIVQFHGDEQPRDCEQIRRPYFKAVRMSHDVDIEIQAQRYASASALLLDSWDDGVVGGTGKVFDWERVPIGVAKKLILAGGLDPDNVASAIRRVRPYAVDVSSGIELGKGVKDGEKMKRFMQEVRSVEHESE